MIKQTITMQWQVFKAFKWHEIMRAVIFSLALATLAVAPFIALFINLLLLYISWLYLYLFLINLCVSIFFYLWIALFYQTLKHYNTASTVDFKRLTIRLGLMKAGFIFLLFSVLILVLTPRFL